MYMFRAQASINFMVYQLCLHKAVKTNNFEQPEMVFQKKQNLFRNKIFGSHYAQAY